MGFPLSVPERVVDECGKEKTMDMAAVEGAGAAGEVNVPAVAHEDGRSGETSDPMEVDLREVGVHFEGMDVVIIADGYDLAGHASKTVVVRYLRKDHGAALDLMDMGLGRNGHVVQTNPPLLLAFSSICAAAGGRTGTER